MEKRNIVLIGFMASGKTSVGRELARRLRRSFMDTDEMVEKAMGLSVAEIFARCGERRFRAEETKAVAKATRRSGRVISTGGGVVLDPANVIALKEHGFLIYLETSSAEALQRVGRTETRPLLKARSFEEIQRLWEERQPIYLSAADLRLSTDGLRVQEVADRLLVMLGGGEAS